MSLLRLHMNLGKLCIFQKLLCFKASELSVCSVSVGLKWSCSVFITLNKDFCTNWVCVNVSGSLAPFAGQTGKLRFGLKDTLHINTLNIFIFIFI